MHREASTHAFTLSFPSLDLLASIPTPYYMYYYYVLVYKIAIYRDGIATGIEAL
jgi:hypothetical protein